MSSYPLEQESAMQTFRVDDMTCGHCVRTITEAVRAADPGAQVQADLAAHTVRIDGARIDAARLAAVIGEAGYSPVAIDPAPMATDGPKPASGCGCGSGGGRCG
jgi:copper chaperone